MDFSAINSVGVYFVYMLNFADSKNTKKQKQNKKMKRGFYPSKIFNKIFRVSR